MPDKKYYNKIKLFYFSTRKNFGDALNINILKYLGAEYSCVDLNEANLVAIGSILHNIITDEKPAKYAYHEYIDVWGSGFIKSKDCEKEYFIKNVNIHALRGKLSKARCEAILGYKLDGIALGDPGLLTSRAVTVGNVEKKYDVGIIPHYYDRDSDLLNKIKLQNKSYKIIDVQGDTRQICKEICECRMILSSAMHGLVAAESYGVPSRWIRFSDNIFIENYKFNDYYSVFNIEGLEPVDLRQGTISDQDIDQFILNYPIRRNDVERICDDLEKAFPRRRVFDLPMSASYLNKIESERNESMAKNKQAIDYFDLSVRNLYDCDFKKAEVNISKYKSLINYDSFSKCDRRSLEYPELSIIIVAYKTGDTLVDCIESLLKNNAGNYEIIVVDNGGNEKIIEKLLEFKLLYISSPHNFGPSEGRNIGVYFAKGEIVAFLDDDAIVGKDYVKNIIESFGENEIIGLRGKIIPKSDHYNNKMAGHYDLGDSCKFIRYVNAETNCAFSKNEYLKLNGMNPLLFGHEGVEFSYRLEKSHASNKILYSPEIIIYHDFAGSDLKHDIKTKRHHVMMSYLKFMNPDIEDFISDLYCFNSDAKQVKLVMTLLVRNEEDIVRYNIDFHLSKGVDFIIATDNGSTDSTRDILREYEEKGVLHLIDEPIHNHNQVEWNNRMAEIARLQYGADIIFHCDADEFWYPRSGNLKDEISKRLEDILVVDVVNVLLEDKGGEEKFPEDTRFAVVNPIVAKDYIEETKEVNMFYFKYPPKVIFKSKNKMLLVSQGNHTVINKDDSVTEGNSQDIAIYHYPIRSEAHFFQKTIMGGSAYEKSDIHSKNTGFHKRHWYASYKKGLLDEEYKKLILHEGETDRLMREGFIEEIDFNNVILGHENNDDGWRYFNRKFEYEEMFHDFYWAWAGHKRFGYDLIRNVKPQTIVELGTHKGTSFFSFCQAVKDARYDANLFAVDTWQGDEHAGFYDDNVFKEVNEIKEKYYSSLKIKLRRERFDEALGEFENNSIDLLHIDGLHAYEAVRHDFEKWFPKVKNDGIILLHDIFISRDDFGVYKLWEELKREYMTIEFHQSYGLGVLFKDSARYQALIGKEREWQIRYSYIAEDKKNEEMRKLLVSFEKSLADRDKQIATLSQADQDKDVHINNLNQSVAERDGQIAGLNQAVSERDSQIASLKQAVAERDGQITGLNQAVSACDGQIAGLNQAVSECDSHIASLHQSAAERDAQIVNLNQSIAERDGQIVGLNQVVTERDSHIASLHQSATERDLQIVNLNQSVTERDGQIVGFNQVLTERDSHIASLFAERDQIFNSTSWKITKPLRVTMKYLRRLIN